MAWSRFSCRRRASICRSWRTSRQLGLAATSGRTGDVWEYHAATGWKRVPGSEGTAPNGLEISKDGQWLYVAGWAEEKLTRLSRGQMPVKKDVIELGFRPENLG
jgi:sugar lactone lactonase YvrE